MTKLLCCLVVAAVLAPTALASAATECVDTFTKGFTTVFSAKRKQVDRCIKDGARDKVNTIEFCFPVDKGNKVAQAKRKNAKKADKKCKETPDYGPSNPTRVNTAAEIAPIALVRDLFGADLDDAIVLQKQDKDTSKCQVDVERELLRCEEAHIEEFERCATKGVKKNKINDSESLAECVGKDPRNKIKKACDADKGKIRDRIQKKCEKRGVDLADAFPGCAQDDADELALCTEERSACRSCQALNEANEISADCDDLDDGQANESCL